MRNQKLTVSRNLVIVHVVSPFASPPPRVDPGTAGIELRLRLNEGASPEHQCSTGGKQSWLRGEEKE